MQTYETNYGEPLIASGEQSTYSQFVVFMQERISYTLKHSLVYSFQWRLHIFHSSLIHKILIQDLVLVLQGSLVQFRQ